MNFCSYGIVLMKLLEKGTNNIQILSINMYYLWIHILLYNKKIFCPQNFIVVPLDKDSMIFVKNG